MHSAQIDMQKLIQDIGLTNREKLAVTCRILFDKGHDSGLAGQITCRSEKSNTFLTQRFGMGFDEITAENLIAVDQDLKPLEGVGMPTQLTVFIPGFIKSIQK